MCETRANSKSHPGGGAARLGVLYVCRFRSSLRLDRPTARSAGEERRARAGRMQRHAGAAGDAGGPRRARPEAAPILLRVAASRAEHGAQSEVRPARTEGAHRLGLSSNQFPIPPHPPDFPLCLRALHEPTYIAQVATSAAVTLRPSVCLSLSLDETRKDDRGAHERSCRRRAGSASLAPPSRFVRLSRCEETPGSAAGSFVRICSREYFSSPPRRGDSREGTSGSLQVLLFFLRK